MDNLIDEKWRGREPVKRTRFVNPMSDIGFKMIFGCNAGRRFTACFLRALLKQDVEDIEFIDKEITPAASQEKGIVCDILCKIPSGNRFLLEMQVTDQPDFLRRALCYSCRCVTGQLEKGGRYGTIKPVVGIFILGKGMPSPGWEWNAKNT